MALREIMLLTVITWLTWLPAAHAAEPCTVVSDPIVDRETRIRSFAAALIPSVYVRLQSTRRRRKRQRLTYSTLREPPEAARLRVGSRREKDWEVGFVWSPIRLIRRTRKLDEARAAARRQRMRRLRTLCRPETHRSGKEKSFNDRLDRAISEEKRHSLEELLN